MAIYKDTAEWEVKAKSDASPLTKADLAVRWSRKGGGEEGGGIAALPVMKARFSESGVPVRFSGCTGTAGGGRVLNMTQEAGTPFSRPASSSFLPVTPHLTCPHPPSPVAQANALICARLRELAPEIPIVSEENAAVPYEVNGAGGGGKLE